LHRGWVWGGEAALLSLSWRAPLDVPRVRHTPHPAQLLRRQVDHLFLTTVPNPRVMPTATQAPTTHLWQPRVPAGCPLSQPPRSRRWRRQPRPPYPPAPRRPGPPSDLPALVAGAGLGPEHALSLCQLWPTLWRVQLGRWGRMMERTGTWTALHRRGGSWTTRAGQKPRGHWALRDTVLCM
jgi:hypothetical protein